MSSKNYNNTFKRLQTVVRDLDSTNPELLLEDHEHFVSLAVAAQCTGSIEEGRESLTGSSNEGGIDAIVCDSRLRTVSLFQAKYRASRSKTEPTASLNEFIHNSRNLLMDNHIFNDFVDNLEPITANGLREARRLLLHEGYELDLYFVTPWRISNKMREKAEREARASAPISTPVRFCALDDTKLLDLFEEWEMGASPPVYAVELETTDLLDSGRGDYACFVPGDNLANIYEQYGPRLFHRNVRGFLERSAINKGIERSIQKHPEDFLSSNKGITIVASSVESTSRRGKTTVCLQGAQIVDGQQTTRCLAAKKDLAAKVRVRVHISEQPPGERSKPKTTRIVEATNSQNTISKADLRSNDQVQVEIERAFGQRKYWYERKRGDLGQKRPQGWPLVRRNELLTASALLEGLSVSSGVAALWEDPHYGKIFAPEPDLLLARWKLWNEVRSLARKQGAEATWAKNVVFSILGKRLRSTMENNPNRFRESISSDAGSRALSQAADLLLKEAHQFYDKNTDKNNPVDVQVFFKQKDSARNFEKYFSSRPQTKRDRLKRILRKIKTEV